MTQILSGPGLFTGRTATVRLDARSGPTTLRIGEVEAPLAAFRPCAAGRTSALEATELGVRVTCVEHFFAAVTAMGIQSGLAIAIDGDEFPLLGGGALEWMRALSALAITKAPPRLVVAREGVVRFGRSELRFARHDDPEDARAACHVWFETNDPRLVPEASWSGDVDAFASRIAEARTFVDARELDAMIAQGYRATVEPTSVVVIAPEAVFAAGRPFAADEPARHKLLDLIGDLALYGGPPRGAVFARRPGHAATHHCVARALAEGILTRCP